MDLNFFSTCSERKAPLKHSSSSPRRRTPAAGGRGRGSGAGWSAARGRGGWQEGSGGWRPATGAPPAAPHRSLSSVTAAGVKTPSSDDHVRLHGAIKLYETFKSHLNAADIEG